MQGPILIIALVVAIIFFLILFLVFARYFRLWIQSVTTGAGIGIWDLIGMTFRKVRPDVIVRSKIMAVQAGLGEETADRLRIIGRIDQRRIAVGAVADDQRQARGIGRGGVRGPARAERQRRRDCGEGLDETATAGHGELARNH